MLKLFGYLLILEKQNENTYNSITYKKKMNKWGKYFCDKVCTIK